MNTYKSSLLFGTVVGFGGTILSAFGFSQNENERVKRLSKYSLPICIALFIISVILFFSINKKDKFGVWEKQLDVAVGEMTKNAVPGAIEVEHRKNLVDWSQAIDENGQCSTREDPVMIMRQKKAIRPVGDFEKRLIANQRHSGKDGRSDQKN